MQHTTYNNRKGIETTMTDNELIEQTRSELERRGVAFSDFWQISRSPGSFTTVWFWGDPKGSPNYSCQFDEERAKLLWSNS